MASGSLTSATAGTAQRIQGYGNASLTGTFVATLYLQRSHDGGTTWETCTMSGAPMPFTAPCSEVIYEPEGQTTYRWNCTSYTSGTINYRIAQ